LQVYWLQIKEKQRRNAAKAINPKGLPVSALR